MADHLDPVRNNFPRPGFGQYEVVSCGECKKLLSQKIPNVGQPSPLERAPLTKYVISACPAHCKHERRMERDDGTVFCGNEYCGIELLPSSTSTRTVTA